MKMPRLAWEPVNQTPLKEIEDRMMVYTKGNGGVTILANGTLLFITDGDDDVADARKAVEEGGQLLNFEVVPLKEGGYLVTFHEALAVFVGHGEFAGGRETILTRLADLQFPGETISRSFGRSEDHLLVGLYARGKLQRDAHNFSFHKRLQRKRTGASPGASG